jgi:hypothetical protein
MTKSRHCDEPVPPSPLNLSCRLQSGLDRSTIFKYGEDGLLSLLYAVRAERVNFGLIFQQLIPEFLVARLAAQAAAGFVVSGVDFQAASLVL